MRLSVVIPVFNEERYIGLCLESLKNQQQPADEIIVIDNNCTDKTIKIARQFGVKIVKEKKQGMIFARNRGFNEAKEEIIARCDADVVLPKDWVKKIKNNFHSQNIDGLTGPILFYDLIWKTILFSQIYNRFMKKRLKGNAVLLGPNMAITKTVWNQVKNQVCLNDRFVHEDIDLAIHIHKIGRKIIWDDQLIVKASGRRIKNNPLSFFVEYPMRGIRTLSNHR